ncbi:MAG: GNAT family N-acetyltransferase [Proteobacteria bacterium]|nr:GNAT family N-acetyltransferase [Pseudomonadota bacterium]
MALTIRAMRPQELPAVRALLTGAALPADDVVESDRLAFWVAERGGALSGVVGLERSGASMLLRSLAVAPAVRGRGDGKALVAFAEQRARESGCRDLHLLTMTAEAFFGGLGYARLERADVPDGVRQTAQFSSLCPASAVCMTRRVGD